MDLIESMKVFIEVAKHNSFVLASEHLNMSAPATSRAIAALEHRLGVKLFHRTTRQVRLTQSGDQYLIDARRIIEDLQEAEMKAAGLNTKPSGTLSITAPVLFGQLHIMPIVLEYLEQYPDVSVKALYLDIVSSLLEDELEVAIRIGHLKDSNLYANEVGKVRRIVCASPKYLEKHGTPSSPSELPNHEIIYTTNFEKTSVWQFRHHDKIEKVTLHPRLRCNQNGSALVAAIQGHGITRLMSYQIANEIDQGKLIPILEAYEEPPLPVNVIHLEGRRANAKVKSFISLATERLAQNRIICTD